MPSEKDADAEMETASIRKITKDEISGNVFIFS